MIDSSSKRPAGMFGFSVVWIGQIVSLLGTNMTGFAQTIWAYEITGSATALALVGFFFVTPLLIFSPIAGAIVDRYNRKLMMMVSDLASGLATIIILVLYTTGNLEIWHLYITSAFQGLFQTFQWPAYSAAITTMLPKEQYGRANGMLSLAESASGIFAPVLAGAMMAFIGFGGILTIDIITFVIAIGALLLVEIPQPQITVSGIESRGTIWKEAAYGFRYILKRPSLLGLQLVFMLGNFFVGIPLAIRAPTILASTNNNELIFGSVNSVGAIGGLVGGLVMSAWGGPKRRIHGVLGGWAISSLFGIVLFGFADGLIGWSIASFIAVFFVPIINGSNQAIWQAKVAPDLQGRVFSIRRLIAWFVTPAAQLVAGPLADFVFEPGIQSNTLMASTAGTVVGTHPGSGMSLMWIIFGFLAFTISIASYSIPVIRNAEEILPDYDQPVPNHEEFQEQLQDLLRTRQRVLAAQPSQGRDRALRHITNELRELGRRRGFPSN
jgi:DHA3 family macrolide efflux protein-like MFS transporter